MEQKKQIRLYLSITMAMVFFSLSFVWFKIANQAYGPLTIILFRLAFSSVVLFFFTRAVKRLVIPDKKDLKYLLLLAFFEPFLYFMGESYGLQYISSTVAAVIISTIPLVAPIAAYVFYRERITRKNLWGILLSFFGVIVVIYEIGAGISASPIGILLQFGAVLSAVGYTIVLHKISARMNNLSIILFQNGFQLRPMLSVFYLSEIPSTLAFIFFTYSVRHLGIVKSNMFTNTIPVFTAIFAWFILGEELNLQKFIGISIVVAGLFLAQFNLKKKSNGPDPIPNT